LSNYKAIYNWVVALGFPENHQQYLNLINSAELASLSELAKNYSDATLGILDSSNNPIQSIIFYDLFPISIDSLMFQSTNQDVQYLIGNATFRYAYYKFE
jgi:hypothetical protein